MIIFLMEWKGLIQNCNIFYRWDYTKTNKLPSDMKFLNDFQATCETKTLHTSKCVKQLVILVLIIFKK